MPIRHFPGRSSGHRISRALAIVLVGLQALLWGGGSIIEARAAAESLTRSSHVEDQGTTACPPIHSHLDCIICRTFASGAVAAGPRDLLPTASRVTGLVDAALDARRTDGFNGPLGSRAPPAARRPSRPVA